MVSAVSTSHNPLLRRDGAIQGARLTSVRTVQMQCGWCFLAGAPSARPGRTESVQSDEPPRWLARSDGVVPSRSRDARESNAQRGIAILFEKSSIEARVTGAVPRPNVLESRSDHQRDTYRRCPRPAGNSLTIRSVDARPHTTRRFQVRSQLTNMVNATTSGRDYTCLIYDVTTLPRQ